MPIRIRSLKKPERGTKVDYATIPIEEARAGIDPTEAKKYLSDFYGQGLTGEVGYRSSKRDPNSMSFSNLYVTEDISDALKDFAQDNARERVLRIVDKRSKKIIKGQEVYGKEEALTLKKIGKRIVITPTPYFHGISGKNCTPEGTNIKRGDSYEHLIGMLNKGFQEGATDEYDNSYVADSHFRHRMWSDFAKPSKNSSTTGDRYAIELFQKEGHKAIAGIGHTIKKSNPENILGINIALSENLSGEEKEERMRFYKEEIAKKYHVPVRFYEGAKVVGPGSPFKRVFPKKQVLEQRLSAIIGIGGFLGSIFFLGSSVTGNAIGNLGKSSGSWLGMVLFLVGIAGVFWYFRSKKR